MAATPRTAIPIFAAALLLTGCAITGCSAQQVSSTSVSDESTTSEQADTGNEEKGAANTSNAATDKHVPTGDPVLDDKTGFNGNSAGPESLKNDERDAKPEPDADTSTKQAEENLVKAAETERLLSALSKLTKGDLRPYPSPEAAKEASSKVVAWANEQEEDDYFSGYEVAEDGISIKFTTPSGAEVWYDFPANAEG